MYRTYASLEMDDKKIAEISPRMKELEDKLGAKNFEQQEEEHDDLRDGNAAKNLWQSLVAVFKFAAEFVSNALGQSEF